MKPPRAKTKEDTLRIRLFVAGGSPNSAAAVSNLRAVLAQHPSVRVDVEIFDVLKTPEAAIADSVLVTPTMIRVAPSPQRRVIGNLKDTDAILAVLGLAAPRE